MNPSRPGATHVNWSSDVSRTSFRRWYQVVDPSQPACTQLNRGAIGTRTNSRGSPSMANLSCRGLALVCAAAQPSVSRPRPSRAFAGRLTLGLCRGYSQRKAPRGTCDEWALSTVGAVPERSRSHRGDGSGPQNAGSNPAGVADFPQRFRAVRSRVAKGVARAPKSPSRSLPSRSAIWSFATSAQSAGQGNVV
jgi:hypothetical protein